MAIQISGCTVIDNSRNITNANNMCVGVVTMTGSSGNIETPGTITAGGINFAPSVVSFSPADGATNIGVDGNIVITFNQFVQKATTGIGTTANIRLRNSSAIGTVIQTIGINSTSVVINGAVVTIDPPSNLPFNTNIYVVIDVSAFNSSGGNSSLINTYDYTTKVVAPGDPYEGGFLICKASPLRWVVSPRSAEVSRTWYNRNDANTRAQQVSGCTGWFVPTVSQLQNPGYCCRSFWGPSPCFSPSSYWSSSEFNDHNACNVSFSTGGAGIPNKHNTQYARAFRCVAY